MIQTLLKCFCYQGVVQSQGYSSFYYFLLICLFYSSHCAIAVLYYHHLAFWLAASFLLHYTKTEYSWCHPCLCVTLLLIRWHHVVYVSYGHLISFFKYSQQLPSSLHLFSLPFICHPFTTSISSSNLILSLILSPHSILRLIFSSLFLTWYIEHLYLKSWDKYIQIINIIKFIIYFFWVIFTRLDSSIRNK